MQDGKKPYDFGIFDLFDDGRHLWFPAIEYNALFMMDKQTGYVKYMGSFPNEACNQHRLYSSITEYQGKLYFTPCSAHEIGVYDMEYNRFEKIDIGIAREDNDVSQVRFAKKFVSGFIQGTTLTLIPCCYDNMVICDLTTAHVSLRSEMFTFFSQKYRQSVTSTDSEFYLCWFAKRINESEVVFNLQSNESIAVFYNLDTGTYREQNIGSKGRTYTMVEYDRVYLWLYDPREDVLVRWKESEKEYIEVSFKEQISGFQSCGLGHSFVNLAALKGWIYFIPANTNAAVKVHAETLQTAVIESLSAECFLTKEEIAYSNLCRISENSLYLFGYRSNRLKKYEAEGTLQQFLISISDQDLDVLKQKQLLDELNRADGVCVLSEEQVSLTDFLEAVQDLEGKPSEADKHKTAPMLQGCGSAIYESMKEASGYVR